MTETATRGILQAALAAAGLLLTAASASAEELPKNLAWTAYDVGSSGYAQAVGIGAALKNERGITLRVLPGKNDVSRLVPLRDGKVHFAAFGIGAIQAIEGTDTFGGRDWGPQEVELLAMSNPDSCSHLLIAGDIGVKSVADLRGKRIAWVKGAPGLNHNAYSILQFAGLGWDDVQKVEFGGYGGSFDGLVEGRVDAVFTVSTSGGAVKAFSGPRGAVWVPLPHDDAAGWQRMMQASPFYYKQICREGAGVDKPFEAAAYPYPILIAYRTQDADMVHAMTKTMFDLYPAYKDAAPGASGWSLDRQVLTWSMPYHEGAIRYYKEAGKWTEAHEANNAKLLAREKVAWGATPEVLTADNLLKARRMCEAFDEEATECAA